MPPMPPRIPAEEDLHAYVDGLIDPARLRDVEVWLAEHPEEAARLRDYHRLNRQVRAGLERLARETPPQTAALEQRLHRHLIWRIALRRAGTAVAASLLLAFGWSLRDWIEPNHAALAMDTVPVFADEAAEAHLSLAVRSLMDEDLPVPEDAGEPARMAEVLTAHAGGTIPLPRPGAELRYVGAALVPWDEGTALQIAYREADGELVTLFVVAEDKEERTVPQAVERDGLRLVYWQSGRAAYTLGGDGSDDDLLRVARQMAGLAG